MPMAISWEGPRIVKQWKLATKEGIESGKGLIAIEDREGYWIEQKDMLSTYLR